MLYNFGDCARWELHWDDGAIVSMLEETDAGGSGRDKAIAELRRLGFEPSETRVRVTKDKSEAIPA